MAVGMKDPVLGPSEMRHVRSQVSNCPLPFEVDKGGPSFRNGTTRSRVRL